MGDSGRVGEAVAEVEPGRVACTAPVSSVGLHGKASLDGIGRQQRQPECSNQAFYDIATAAPMTPSNGRLDQAGDRHKAVIIR